MTREKLIAACQFYGATDAEKIADRYIKDTEDAATRKDADHSDNNLDIRENRVCNSSSTNQLNEEDLIIEHLRTDRGTIKAVLRRAYANEEQEAECDEQLLRAAYRAIIGFLDKSPYADYTWEDVAMIVQENRMLKDILKNIESLKEYLECK